MLTLSPKIHHFILRLSMKRKGCIIMSRYAKSYFYTIFIITYSLCFSHNSYSLETGLKGPFYELDYHEETLIEKELEVSTFEDDQRRMETVKRFNSQIQEYEKEKSSFLYDEELFSLLKCALQKDSTRKPLTKEQFLDQFITPLTMIGLSQAYLCVQPDISDGHLVPSVLFLYQGAYLSLKAFHGIQLIKKNLLFDYKKSNAQHFWQINENKKLLATSKLNSIVHKLEEAISFIDIVYQGKSFEKIKRKKDHLNSLAEFWRSARDQKRTQFIESYNNFEKKQKKIKEEIHSQNVSSGESSLSKKELEDIHEELGSQDKSRSQTPS